MDHLALAARLEVIKWRDGQFEAVTDQLEAGLPELLGEVSAMTENAGVLELVKTSVLLRRAVENAVRAWSAEQARVALIRAEIALDQTLSGLGDQLRLDHTPSDMIVAGLQAGSGVSMIAGSLLAIPTVIAYAGVTTTGFLGLFATSSISIPIIAVGGLGLGILAITGSTMVERAMRSAKDRLQQRLIGAVEIQVMGYGRAAGDRSVLSDIQAMILVAGKQKVEATL